MSENLKSRLRLFLLDYYIGEAPAFCQQLNTMCTKKEAFLLEDLFIFELSIF